MLIAAKVASSRVRWIARSFASSGAAARSWCRCSRSIWWNSRSDATPPALSRAGMARIRGSWGQPAGSSDCQAMAARRPS